METSIVSRVALLALLSGLAYSPLAKVKETWTNFSNEHSLLQEFIKNVETEPILIESDTPCEDTQVYVFHHNACIYIAFRGSSSTADFAADLDVRRYCLDHQCSVPVPPRVTIHQGFYEQYRSVENQLFKTLETLTQTNPGIPICITGHSLGSALSQIAAAHIGSHPLFQTHHISCITFGTPRVGNRSFASWYESCVDSHLRVVHWYDPVPNLPILPFWQHANGECIYFTETKTRLVSKDVPWLQRVFWILKYVWPWPVLYLKGHAIDVYVDIWTARYERTLKPEC